MGKGEIARNEQFLLFPQCFLLNQIIVSPFVHSFDFISLFGAELAAPNFGMSGKGLMTPRNRTFENILEKGKLLVIGIFSLYQHVFYLF